MNWTKAVIGSGLLFMLLSASCGETKEVQTEEKEKVEITGVIATVTTDYASEGCAVLLEIKEDEEMVLLWPIELEERYKVDGKKVQIVFHSSRIVQTDCQKGRPVVIETIKFVD